MSQKFKVRFTVDEDEYKTLDMTVFDGDIFYDAVLGGSNSMDDLYDVSELPTDKGTYEAEFVVDWFQSGAPFDPPDWDMEVEMLSCEKVEKT